MIETVTLEVPDELARPVHALATATHRRFEDVVLDWLRRASEEPPVEPMPDGDRLALCDATLDQADQEALSALLAGHCEGSLRGEVGHADGFPSPRAGPQGASPQRGRGSGAAPTARPDFPLMMELLFPADPFAR